MSRRSECVMAVVIVLLGAVCAVLIVAVALRERGGTPGPSPSPTTRVTTTAGPRTAAL